MIDTRPQQPLSAAVIGLGHIARQHIRAVQRLPHARLVGVCDRSPATAEATAERYAVPRWFTDHAQMIDELRPDVVHITTPPASHVPLAEDALARGAHVIVEKPLAMNYADVPSLLGRAGRQQRVLIEDYNYVFDPQVQRLLELIDGGEFGAVVHVDVTLCLEISQAAGGVAHADASSISGGPIGDFLPHLASLVSFLAGPSRTVRTIRPAELEFRAMIEAARGTAAVNFSGNAQPDGFWLSVYGTRMQANVNLFEPHCTIRRLRMGPRPLTPLWNGLDAAKATRRAAWRGLSRKLSGGPGAYEGLWRLLQRSYDALSTNAPPPVLPEQIDEVNRLVHQLASEEGRA